ncbi:ankyrin repeat-containing domain protein [Dichotomopilus funicola]|uniref:Ankyrin repeat-containing domain protein n=1 Tax=Dichotomopilus funicola TaxID=1934379 RepID=A0AAN6UYR0_9PEZI|nr:ankyrin repeat-containing domain protein [Dichotomopilus funicola]
MDHITFVVVPGLHDPANAPGVRSSWQNHPASSPPGGLSGSTSASVSAGHLLWDPYWAHSHQRLVFCGENLGGIIVKRALTLAGTDTTIAQHTCACILLGVPHKAPSLEAWRQTLTSIVLPFWTALPDGFWQTTADLPAYLKRVSSEFIPVAFSIAIVSICQDGASAAVDTSCGVLGVSHEHVVLRDSAVRFSQIGRFNPSQRGAVDGVFSIVKAAASASSPALTYLKTLARLSPHTHAPSHTSYISRTPYTAHSLSNSPLVQATVHPLLDAITATLPEIPANTVAINLYGARGIGKTTLSYALHEQLLRGRAVRVNSGPTPELGLGSGPGMRPGLGVVSDPKIGSAPKKEYIAYFAFDTHDHRRRSVRAMLVKVIRQLLASEPGLANRFMERERGKKWWKQEEEPGRVDEQEKKEKEEKEGEESGEETEAEMKTAPTSPTGPTTPTPTMATTRKQDSPDTHGLSPHLDRTRWTEGNLWIQMRSTLRHLPSASHTHLVLDAVDTCDTPLLHDFLRDLLDLRFAAAGTLTIWFTSVARLEIMPVEGSQTGKRRSMGTGTGETWHLDIERMPDFEACRSDFQATLAAQITSLSPKFRATQPELRACLDAAENFTHANLLAHRIRGIDQLSRPQCVSAGLEEIKKGWEETITAMVQGAPGWVVGALVWMLFVRRPLGLDELAVAVALAESDGKIEAEMETETATGEAGTNKASTIDSVSSHSPVAKRGLSLNESLIPLDIGTDLCRALGPLVEIDTDREEIRIAHSYVAEVLQEWITSAMVQATPAQRLVGQTQTLLEYLHFCLERIGAAQEVSEEKVFGLLEYALEHWHVHYCQVMDDNDNNDDSEGSVRNDAHNELQQLARALFENPRNMRWLASRKYLNPEPESPAQAAEIGGSESLVRPVLLAARLGLFSIFKQLFNATSEPDHPDRLDALRVACQSGHLPIVQYLIQDSAMTANSATLESLITEACERGDEHVVLALLDPLREVRAAANQDPYTIPSALLIQACRIGHASLAQRLIEAGAYINADSDSEVSPLHAAIMQGHLDVVSLLLENGAQVNRTADRGWTPLQCSIRRGYRYIASRLLAENGVLDNANEDGLTSAHLAARVGDVDLLRQVIDLERDGPGLGADVDGGEWDEGPDKPLVSQPLHEAAEHGHVAAVEFLVEHSHASIDAPNADGKTALYLALAQNHTAVVDALLRHGAAVTTDEDYATSALRQAIIHGNVPVTMAILKTSDRRSWRGSKSSPSETTAAAPCSALTDAARHNQFDIFRALIYDDADIQHRVDHHQDPDRSNDDDSDDDDHDGQDDEEEDEEGEARRILGENSGRGWAAAHFAAYYGSADIMRLLVELGPDVVNAKTACGHTPLHLAVHREEVDVVQILLSPPALPLPLPIPSDMTDDAFRPPRREDSFNSRVSSSSSTTARATAIALATIPTTVVAEQQPQALVVDVDTPTNRGRTALHIAAGRGESAELVKLLLDRGASPRAADGKGKTPLHFAAAAAGSSVRKSSVMATTATKTTRTEAVLPAPTTPSLPLSRMARTKSLTGIITTLLAAGADPGARDSTTGRTPLHYAAQAGSVVATALLLRHGSTAATTTASVTAAGIATGSVKSGNSNSGNPLAAVADDAGITPLYLAAEGGHVKVLLLLLGLGAKVAAGAKRGDELAAVAALGVSSPSPSPGAASSGANVNVANRQGATALHAAVIRGHLGVVDILLRAGANPDLADEVGDTPLHEAARRGHHQITERLVKGSEHSGAVASLNLFNTFGITPLHRAVLNGWSWTVRVLLEAGADPNLVDGDGDTALEAAIASGTYNVVEVLLQLNETNETAEAIDVQDHARGPEPKNPEKPKLRFPVNLNVQNKQGKTPLMRAARACPEALRPLLDAGADATLRDHDQNTLLHEIAFHPKLLPVNTIATPALLAHPQLQTKEQLLLTNNEGLTPTHAAARRSNGLLIKWFAAFGNAVVEARDRQGRTALHHAVRTLGKDELRDAFGDVNLRPSLGVDGTGVNVPDADGWTPLHWACRGSQTGVVKLLLSQYRYPLRALRYQGRSGEAHHGWSAIAVAVFHRNLDAIKFIQHHVWAMDPEWSGREKQPPPEKLPDPPTSAEEAFVARDGGGGDEISPDVLKVPGRARIRVEWSARFGSGLRSDGKVVVPGTLRQSIGCDDCHYVPMYGARFKCVQHVNFDLCFKCYWHHETTHTPPGHSFEKRADGPVDGPPLATSAPVSPEERLEQQRQAALAPKPTRRREPIIVTHGSGGPVEIVTQPRHSRPSSHSNHRRSLRWSASNYLNKSPQTSPSLPRPYIVDVTGGGAQSLPDFMERERLEKEILIERGRLEMARLEREHLERDIDNTRGPGREIDRERERARARERERELEEIISSLERDRERERRNTVGAGTISEPAIFPPPLPPPPPLHPYPPPFIPGHPSYQLMPPYPPPLPYQSMPPYPSPPPLYMQPPMSPVDDPYSLGTITGRPRAERALELDLGRRRLRSRSRSSSRSRSKPRSRERRYRSEASDYIIEGLHREEPYRHRVNRHLEERFDGRRNRGAPRHAYDDYEDILVEPRNITRERERPASMSERLREIDRDYGREREELDVWHHNTVDESGMYYLPSEIHRRRNRNRSRSRSRSRGRGSRTIVYMGGETIIIPQRRETKKGKEPDAAKKAAAPETAKKAAAPDTPGIEKPETETK